MRKAVVLRDVREDDIPIFFKQQLDSAANHMAAFTRKDPTDRAAFLAHWQNTLEDERVTMKTILVDGEVVGHVASFEQMGEREIAYWIGKEHWGKGIATLALKEFLGHVVKERPLHARAAKDNVASLRVLENCGFVVTGRDKGFANARCEEVEELVLTLAADAKGPTRRRTTKTSR